MSTQRLDLAEARLAQADNRRGLPVSRLLMEDGAVSASDAVLALAEARRIGVQPEEVLAADSLASREDILAAQSQHYGAMALRRHETPPDPALSDLLPAAFCVRHGVCPWLRIGRVTVLATARPDRFEALLDILPPGTGPVMMAVTLEQDIHDTIADWHGATLAAQAETLRAPEDSCRDLNTGSVRSRVLGLGLAALCLGLLATAPAVLFAVALAAALLSLFTAQGLKLAALIAAGRAPAAPPTPVLPDTLPRVSLLVPLFREEAIADTLVRRLERLSYPKAQLEVLLVLEAEDDLTRATLDATHLPPWMRVIVVPPGGVTTKPRALNYAFGFTTGEIVGIYDAEDAPAPDQLDRVVARFAEAPPRTACLQGILDFYNPRANWLSRCFAVEYASWFRVLLPGLVRLGLAIPLGGTTVFFRRDALDAAGGWDAHNVTEDADLGMRLARLGFATELLPSVTREEANNRFWPWIRQRSRWLKGYAITWWVHSRRPLRLWRDLGPWRFVGLQLLFLTTLVQFALAPVLWSFWLVLFGLPHPSDGLLGPALRGTVIGLFLTAEGIAILVGLAAVARSPHARLFPWVPTLFAYFPLGTLAIYKALWETFTRPFYWDKTQHGRSAPDGGAPGG